MRSAVLPVLGLCAVLVLAPAFSSHGETEGEREGGIIGTGIVGTVTDLGSIWVNGQHIRFDPDLPVTDGIGLATASQIRRGHTVAVVATPDGSDWQARDIRQVLPLVGPVSAVNGASLTVLGNLVHAPGPVTGVVPGEWIAVSGLWRENEVVASRLERIMGDSFNAQITGTYLGPDSQGRVRIGNVPILGLLPQHLQPGDVVRATGQPEPGGLRVEKLEKGLFTAPVALVQAEGYFSPPRADGLYTVLGSGLVAYTDQPDMMHQMDRGIACGRQGAMVPSEHPEQMPALPPELKRRLNCP